MISRQVITFPHIFKFAKNNETAEIPPKSTNETPITDFVENCFKRHTLPSKDTVPIFSQIGSNAANMPICEILINWFIINIL